LLFFFFLVLDRNDGVCPVLRMLEAILGLWEKHNTLEYILVGF
jgi:hypothetical protein